MGRRILVGIALICASALAAGCTKPNLDASMGLPSEGTPDALAITEACAWPQGSTTGSAAASSAPVHHIGEAAPLGDLTVTVNEVFCPTMIATAGEATPGTGERVVIVDFSVENTGPVPRTVSSNFQAWLMDGTGREYGSDVTATHYGGEPINGDVPAGGKRSGRAGFRIPASATNLVFIFDSHPFSDEGQVVVALQ